MFAIIAISAALAAPAADITVEPGWVTHGEITGVVDVPMEEVLGIVLDCENADRWFPDTVNTEVVYTETGKMRCAGETNLPWPFADRTWHIDVTGDVQTIDGVESWVLPFAYVDGTGNVEVLEGRYLLQDAGNGRTKVTYQADVGLGFWIPEPLLNWGTRRILPGILSGIESQADRVMLAQL